VKAVAKLRAWMGEVATGRFVGPEAERVTFEDLMAGLEPSYQLAGRRSIRRVQTAKEHLTRAFAVARADEITAPRLEAYALARTLDDEAAPASEVRVGYPAPVTLHRREAGTPRPSASVPDHPGGQCADRLL
jgi:hypothetical protein